jgi:hypothetical protein
MAFAVEPPKRKTYNVCMSGVSGVQYASCMFVTRCDEVSTWSREALVFFFFFFFFFHLPALFENCSCLTLLNQVGQICSQTISEGAKPDFPHSKPFQSGQNRHHRYFNHSSQAKTDTTHSMPFQS